MGKTKWRKSKNVDTQNSDNFVDEEESNQVNKKWFEENADNISDFKPVTEEILIKLKDEAKKCHDAEVANYNIKNAKTNSNYKWMKTAISKGTVSDKIAAATITIQDNPVCSLDVLQNLINMVKVGKKKECTLVMDTLTELFLSDLLRPNQKLKAFHQKPLSVLDKLSSGNAVTRRKLLSSWYFEDQLKESYTSFVLALNNVAHDVLDNNKEKAITAMFKLLNENPEQEKNLLTYLVNKLGDPSQKVASKAIYSLGQLLFRHPNMQGVVLNEVEKLLFRANISHKAQYYGLCFLSQFYLSHDNAEVPRRLIEVYFSFFKACIKKGEVDSRMMSALLMGVNRAYPYAKFELDKISDHIDTMYRIVHVATFNIGLHALSLLLQVSDRENSVSDRFYSALYKKLIDPKLFTTTHQAMLLSLIYKALLKDTETSRVKIFIKRLLQLTLFMQPSFACGVLYLISQLMGKKQDIQSLVIKQSKISFEDDDEERYHDVKTEEVTEKKQEKKESETENEDIKPNIDDLNQLRPSWDHSKITREKHLCYNPLSRNPLYAGGDLCAYTELIKLKDHFHPTVALYATNILEGNIIKYSGDPLKDFTLIRFLDRFVFKNPKKYDEGSVKGAHPTFGKRKIYHPVGLRSLPVNSANYLNINSKSIPVDELFMHNYLQKKYKERHRERTDGSDNESDVESVQSEEFEEMLDKMAGISNKDEDLDFLNDIGDALQQKEKNKKNKKQAEDNEMEQSDDEEQISDEEMSIDDDFENEDDVDFEMDDSDKELLEDVSVNDESEEIVFDDEETPQKGKLKKKRGNKSGDVTSIFASAEEFASLLDDQGTATVAPGSSSALENKDNASVKQIAWEDKRNRWLKGFNKAVSGHKNKKITNYERKRKNQKQSNVKAKKSKNK